MPIIKILIADGLTLMRQGLHRLCREMGGFEVVGEADSGARAVALARSVCPDVIVIDLGIDDADGAGGIEAIQQILSENPSSRVIVLTMLHRDQTKLDAITAGARCYLSKTVDAGELGAAIRAVHQGDYLIDPLSAARALSQLHQPRSPTSRPEPLTKSEMAVLRLVAQGAENREIARALDYSVYTVANRLRTIYEKLQVVNRTQAALYALREGWVALD